MPRKQEPTKKPQLVTLWSGHDVNLTIPFDYGFGGYRHSLASPTLGQVREFVRLAQDAGYTDDATVSVDIAGLKIRRDGATA